MIAEATEQSVHYLAGMNHCGKPGVDKPMSSKDAPFRHSPSICLLSTSEERPLGDARVGSALEVDSRVGSKVIEFPSGVPLLPSL